MACWCIESGLLIVGQQLKHLAGGFPLVMLMHFEAFYTLDVFVEQFILFVTFVQGLLLCFICLTFLLRCLFFFLMPFFFIPASFALFVAVSALFLDFASFFFRDQVVVEAF